MLNLGHVQHHLTFHHQLHVQLQNYHLPLTLQGLVVVAEPHRPVWQILLACLMTITNQEEETK